MYPLSLRVRYAHPPPSSEGGFGTRCICKFLVGADIIRPLEAHHISRGTGDSSPTDDHGGALHTHGRFVNLPYMVHTLHRRVGGKPRPYGKPPVLL